MNRIGRLWGKLLNSEKFVVRMSDGAPVDDRQQRAVREGG
jgi:hypothetical protein